MHDFTTTPATTGQTASAYLTTSTADVLANTLPGLAAYKALTTDAKAAVLVMASLRIDASRRWQGRKYDLDQELEFPRVVSPSPVLASIPNPGVTIQGILDWDATNNVAVVPQNIKLACLFEANSIADGKRDKIAELIGMGITGRSTGSLSEQYRAAFAGQAGSETLCRDAELLVNKYRLRTGGLL